MEDYFDLAHSSEENKAMMGRFKLEKSAKLWWKDHCKERAIDPANVSWDYLSTQLSKSYQTRTYRVDKINEFLDSVQGGDTLDIFYQRFLKLLKKVCTSGHGPRGKGCTLCLQAQPPTGYTSAIPKTHHLRRCARCRETHRARDSQTHQERR